MAAQLPAAFLGMAVAGKPKMNRLVTTTIKRKLTSIMMAACSIVLLLACAALLYFEVASFKKMLVRSTRVIAEVIGANSAPALSLNSQEAARKTLYTLKAEPYVLSAFVYTRTGELFAAYRRNENRLQIPPLPPKHEGYIFTKNSLQFFHTIYAGRQRAGTLLIEADLRVIREQLQAYLSIVAAVMISATLVAFLLSLRLQRVVSQPISHLAEVANRVARERNYSICAVRTSSDEMGQLIDRFNEMLSGIQERDAALLRAQEELEKRVDERTKELQLEISERARVEAALRISQQKFETLVHSVEAVVWEADPKTLAFTFVSQQAERLLGFPRETWLHEPAFWSQRVSPKDQVKAQELRAKALLQEKPIQIEYRMVASDGRIHWVREISTCTFQNGSPETFRGVFFDITEQKEAEEEMDLLNRRLLASSRQAGMAEVATGVLHNVGNVLNSVNVSSTLVCDQIRNSRASRLKDIADLLKENATNLGDFVTNHPKGKAIPAYLTSLSERLHVEQQSVLKELDLLTKNIEHIKEIVTMQQSYARVSGVLESLPIQTIVEDALQMNAAALTRHGILVTSDFQNVPPTALDKHKVLQILVNLIRNAKYAIDAAARQDKRLNLTIRLNDRQMIEIVVADNGIGIAKENMTRIFSHGFTTKKDGHGFGLHSGALAAKEMGGSLRACSEGEGNGAMFILELPPNNTNAATKTDTGAKEA